MESPVYFAQFLINANNHVTHTSMKIKIITSIRESPLGKSLFWYFFYPKFILEFYMNKPSFTQCRVFEIQIMSYILDGGAPNCASDNTPALEFVPRGAHTSSSSSPCLPLSLQLLCFLNNKSSSFLSFKGCCFCFEFLQGLHNTRMLTYQREWFFYSVSFN